MTVVSAPAGSGKTFLLASWVRESGLWDRVAWLSVQGAKRDEQRFWLALLDALRETGPGSTRVRALTPAPDLDGWAIVERLLDDLGSLDETIWLVVDDLHELGSEEARRQFELLLMRAPPQLRFVLVARHDLRLGLHRLRLEGGLTEIRANDLWFSLDEARALFEAAGIELSDAGVGVLHERTEGWAAGLRLAALSLREQPDPERLATEFSGSERTVAEYLLAEVLERQPPHVRRLLLRTSILGQVNGALADVLTGGSGGERILQELEAANAFVVSLDVRRSWFRYHALFAELLRLELRRAAPDEIPVLHAAAARWHAQHGDVVEAVRHAQAAQDWRLASRLLSDTGFAFYLGGRAATAHELLAGFPVGVAAADPELGVVAGADELHRGSLDEAARRLATAENRAGSVPVERRERFAVMLGVLRLSVARQRADLPTVVAEAGRLLASVESAGVVGLGMSEDLPALALISLGTAEAWTYRLEDAERHLQHGLALARRLGQPYLEAIALAQAAMVAGNGLSFAIGMERSAEAIELIERHGWSEEPVAALAYVIRGNMLIWQGRLDDGERLLDRAERAIQLELEPAIGVLYLMGRIGLDRVRGRHSDALERCDVAARLAHGLITAPIWLMRVRCIVLQTLVRMDQPDRVESGLAELSDAERDSGEMRATLAILRFAQDRPLSAANALAPTLERPEPRIVRVKLWILEARARAALGEAAAAERSLERALELAEVDGLIYPFLLDGDRAMLERHPAHRTAHAGLLGEILGVFAGIEPAGSGSRRTPLREPLSRTESRVLRYLPTNLSQREIADELYVSPHTVKTHVRHLYGKLGAHGRAEAVERARALGLLAPSLRA